MKPLQTGIAIPWDMNLRWRTEQLLCGNTKVIGNATSAGIATAHTNVFYLNIFPYINARESDTAFTIGNVILVSVGVLLIAVALRIGTKAKPHGKKCKGGV